MKKLFSVFSLLFSFSAHADIALSGDFRFRTENIKEEQASPLSEADRTRQRMRLRVGGVGKVNADTDAIVRFATGTTATTDNTSTNQDFTDYYSKKAVVLDLAYFNWKACDTMTVMGGKTPIPFSLVGGNDLIFDADLTPEGLSLKYLQPLENGIEILVNTSATWLNERFSATGATDNTDVGLIGAQLGASYKADTWTGAITASAFNFSNIKGSTAAAARGNTLSGGLYTQDYKLTSIGLEVGTLVAELPLLVYADTVSNSDGGNYKAASVVGIKYGKMKAKGSWAVAADTREVEADALVGVLSDADSAGGGADIRSTRFVGGYQVAENANIALTYFVGKKSISSTTFSPNFNRAQLDFNFQF